MATGQAQDDDAPLRWDWSFNRWVEWSTALNICPGPLLEKIRLNKKEYSMNQSFAHRFLYKPSFVGMFDPDVEILHDGQGVVMVLLPDMVVTIKAANDGTV